MRFKDVIRRALMKRVHAVDVNMFVVSDAVVARGVTEFLSLDYAKLRNELLHFIDGLKVGEYAYKYSSSSKDTCLYSSVYAVMLEGLLGHLKERSSADLNSWGMFLNSFQSESDGLYYDDRLNGAEFEHRGIWNEGWGKHHLLGHIVIALPRLGVTPCYPFRFLRWAYDNDELIRWMESFDFSKDVWTVSNYFMNLYSALEYSRDWMNDSSAKGALDTMCDWLTMRQRPDTGMWHDRDWDELSVKDRYNVIRGAYHFYPLFEYEGITLPHMESVIRRILPMQNRWGGWTEEGANSGACEDIDALEPILRYATACTELKDEINLAVRRSMVWQLACRNSDGGFSFGCRSAQEYGGHPLMSSNRDESSLFATWFRTLLLAYEMRHLGIPNEFDLGTYPGYEIA